LSVGRSQNVLLEENLHQAPVQMDVHIIITFHFSFSPAPFN